MALAYDNGVDTIGKPPLLNEAVGLADRPYQRVGIEFLWRSRRAMITDAPGLGKTPQGALAAELPCLVVCPTYLVPQWEDWLKEHLPKRKVIAARGSRADKVENMLVPTDFLIINKEMLRTHRAEVSIILKRYRYKTIIFDEAHHLRNYGTAVSITASALAKQVERVYLLTATPIWKEVDDLFMPLHLIAPDLFPSYNRFVDDWCVVDDSKWGRKVMGIQRSELDQLNELMDVVRLGRTYEEAGRDLPPVIEKPLVVDFSKSERERYNKAVEQYRLALEDHEDLFMQSYMEVMHTLRNMTGLEKIEAIKEAVEESRPYHNGKYVIYTWYRDLAERLHAQLPDSIYISGDMKPEERTKLAKLQKPIITTISALSEGVDLSWARTLIYAEEHWVPGSQVQSMARVRRERQVEIPTLNPDDCDCKRRWIDEKVREASRQANEEPIIMYTVMVSDTIDVTIHSTSRRRSATVKQVLSEALGIYL